MADKNTQIQELTSRIAERMKLRGDYVASLDAYKKWLTSTEADRIEREKMLSLRPQQIASIDEEVALLKKQIETLTQSIQADNRAAVTLSTQGISQAALMLKADGDAQAAQIVAKSQAEATNTAAKTDADNSKLRNTVFVAVGLILLVVAAAIAVRKFKQSKGSK